MSNMVSKSNAYLNLKNNTKKSEKSEISMNDKKKSMAKAMGKNQTLTNGKDVVITNFDKNNQIEKTVVDNVVTDTNKTKPAFSKMTQADTL